MTQSVDDLASSSHIDECITLMHFVFLNKLLYSFQTKLVLVFDHEANTKIGEDNSLMCYVSDGRIDVAIASSKRECYGYCHVQNNVL